MNFVPLHAEVSNKSITCIQEDADGFVWIGTIDAGLYRYDGMNCRHYGYEAEDSHGLSSNVIFDSFLDENGKLWVSTNEGLSHYDPLRDCFVEIPLSFYNGHNYPIPARALIDDGNGDLLIGTMHNGLFRYRPQDSIAHRLETQWNGERTLVINKLVKTATGRIFAATNMGLMYYQENEEALLPYVLPAPASAPGKDQSRAGTGTYITESLVTLIVGEDNTLWLGTQENGLMKVYLDQKKQRVERFPVTTKRVLSLALSPGGDVLAGTENDGLVVVSAEGKIQKRYTANQFDDQSIGSNSVWEIMYDKANRLWLGFYNKGVSVFDPLHDKFNAYQSKPNKENSLQSGSVTALAEDRKGRIWISTDGGGIDLVDPVSGRIRHVNSRDQRLLSGLTNDNLLCVLVDRKDNVWIGSWDGGVFMLPAGAKRFRHFDPTNTGGGLPSDKVMHVSEDSRGRIWFATFGGGVAYYDPVSRAFNPCDGEEFQANRLTKVDVRAVLGTRDGNVWVGTTGGLFTLRPADNGAFNIEPQRHRMTKAVGGHFSANHILSLYEAYDGTLWIGTDGGGLFAYDAEQDTFKRYTSEQGLETTVKSITQDADGNLWLSGKEGISVINEKSGRVTIYTKDDGLLANGFYNGAVLRGNDGTLYFGSYEGVNYFQPRTLTTNTEEPRVYLNDLKIFSKSVRQQEEDSPLDRDIMRTKSITLTAQQSMFSLDFVGVSMTRPEKNQYAYRLLGFNDDWQHIGTRRSATFTNLPAGDYVFEAKAANNDGVWSSEPARLSITVLPPWYFSRTAWFLYALLAVGMIFLLRNFDRRRYAQKQAIELERKRHLQEEELNEKKLQFFTNISHEFRTPLTLILNPMRELITGRVNLASEAAREKLDVVYRNSDKLSRLVNELMDFREMRTTKPEPRYEVFNLESRVAYITEYFEEEGRRRFVTLTNHSEQRQTAVRLDPTMLEKILFNLISNAFKVTEDGGAIEVSVAVDEGLGEYRIAVKDTGVGLDPEDLEKIFERFHRVERLRQQYYSSTGIGLEVVKTLVEVQGGTVRVASEKGVGSTFTVVFPLERIELETETPTEEVTASDKFTVAVKQGIKVDSDALAVSAKVHTLLVVEDNGELRDYLRDVLKQQFIVITARNGLQGYNLAKEKQPDVILTDVVMPIMDGVEMCAKIRSDSATSHIPVLMLTARTQVQDRLKGIDSGADAYLDKPFDLQVLTAQLRQLVKCRQLLFEKYYGAIAEKSVETTNSADTEFMNKLLKIVNDRIGDQKLSVESLSADFHLSRSHLYRKTRALTGMSVNQFIRRVRLERAKELLEQKRSSVSEVAYQVGFSSPSYFAKCFKEQFKYLPNEIAK